MWIIKNYNIYGDNTELLYSQTIGIASQISVRNT